MQSPSSVHDSLSRGCHPALEVSDGTHQAISCAVHSPTHHQGHLRPHRHQELYSWLRSDLILVVLKHFLSHDPDSSESAEREISSMFPEFDLRNWYQNEEEYFRNGMVTFCAKEQIHKMKRGEK